jgi:dihydrofolate reductase
MLISIIVAMGPDRLIGAGGRLPWHLPEDLKRFKARTLGHTLIMGRKTFASLGRALPGRQNFVISRNPNPPPVAGVTWFQSLEDALDAARRAGETECFLGGGTAVYAEGLKRADRMYVTYVPRNAATHGDAYFPQWDESQWRELSRQTVEETAFVDYERAARPRDESARPG